MFGKRVPLSVLFTQNDTYTSIVYDRYVHALLLTMKRAITTAIRIFGEVSTLEWHLYIQ